MGKQWKQCQTLFFGAPKSLQMVTAAMTNLDSIFKSRDITLPTTVCLVKAMVFPVVMYGCENWTMKKAEHRRTDAFELWCWRRLLRILYIGQEATVKTGQGTTDWFQTRKGVCQGCILSPCLFNLYAEYIMRNAGWIKHKLESRLLGEMSMTSDMQMIPPYGRK